MAKRIAIVLPDLRLGGGQRVLLELARCFIGHGHSVDIVTLVGDGDLGSELPNGSMRYSLLSAQGGAHIWQGVKALLALVRYLYRVKPDSVLSSMTGTNLLTAMASRMARRRGRLVLREAASFANLRSRRLFPLLMRVLYRRADALIAVSRGVANDLAGLRVAKERIHVINNSIDIERLRNLASQAPHSAIELKWPYIVSIARLVRQKDHETLLRAYAASKLVSSHRLVIIGDGELKLRLIQIARDLGIENQVLWLGAMRNPYAVLSKASLLVLSSRWEGYPNVLLEAAGFGVPIVATDCPDGPRDLLQDGRYGRLVPVGDYAAMARAMEDELQQPAANLEEMIAAHQPHVVARQYMNLLFGDTEKGEA